MSRHLSKMGAANLNRALRIPALTVFVSQRGKVAAGILVELCLKLPKPVVIHQLPRIVVACARVDPLKDAPILPSARLAWRGLKLIPYKAIDRFAAVWFLPFFCLE